MKLLLVVLILVGCVAKPSKKEPEYIAGCSKALIIAMLYRGEQPHFEGINDFCTGLYEREKELGVE